MELAFSFFELILEIVLHSLEFLDVLSGVIEFVSQGIGDFFMSIFHRPHILGMNGNKSIFHVLQLDIWLLLNSVDLFFQYGDFMKKLPPITLVLFGYAVDFR